MYWHGNMVMQWHSGGNLTALTFQHHMTPASTIQHHPAPWCGDAVMPWYSGGNLTTLIFQYHLTPSSTLTQWHGGENLTVLTFQHHPTPSSTTQHPDAVTCMDDNREFQYWGIFPGVIPTLGGWLSKTFKWWLLLVLGYHWLSPATTHLVGDNKEFELWSRFWAATPIMGGW